MNQSEKFRRLFCTEAIRKDLRTSSVRAAGFTWAAGTADFVLRIGSTAILGRLLLPEQFGLIMMVMAVTAIADQFRDLGLSTATVQRKEISHQEVTNLFWINVLAGILIAAVVCAASPLVSEYYKEPRLTLITCILATNFIFGGLMVQHQALLTRSGGCRGPLAAQAARKEAAPSAAIAAIAINAEQPSIQLSTARATRQPDAAPRRSTP